MTQPMKLILHNTDKVSTVDEFRFEIGESSGCWEANITLTDEKTGEKNKIPVWMALEMLKDGLLYPVESKEFMELYWKAKEKNNGTKKDLLTM